MSDVDPFTRAYDAIWAALRADTRPVVGFATLVKVGNQKDFTGAGAQGIPKGSVQPADVPEVWLLPAQFAFSPFGSNSRIAEVQQTFQLVCTTANLRLDKLNPVKWAAMVALARAGEDLGLPGFVKTWDVTSAQDGAIDGSVSGFDTKHGKKGFDSLINVTVLMYIPRERLLSA